ncbi:hypothetical protein H8A87_16155 [Xenorhabdus sp. VLS]|uniref:Uncharacterized protein n=1 Tax=Xenorhabdus lircayensis TaxID=2763499 RepID=A0ABS0UBR2_9GAMM|nr:hypothetical protein [Xenorhabdus lircayensis]
MFQAYVVVKQKPSGIATNHDFSDDADKITGTKQQHINIQHPWINHARPQNFHHQEHHFPAITAHSIVPYSL